MNQRLIVYLVSILILIALPAVGAYPIFLMKVLCYALFASAFNLLLAYTGLLSFGHAAFIGTAGYAAGHALKIWGLTTLQGVLFGTAMAAILGCVIGALAIRRSGIYFAMITLAVAQMIFFFFVQADFTHGEDGLQGIPRGSVFGIDLSNDLNLYYFVLVIFVFGAYVCWRSVNSPFGQILKALRENEARTISLGYNVNHFKWMVFVISATLTGMAGATKSLVFMTATLSDATWQMSGIIVLMTLLGGLGTFFGPILGAIIVVLIEDKLGSFGYFLSKQTGLGDFQILGETVSIVIGLVFVVCVMRFRKGIVGTLIDKFPVLR